MRNFRTATNGTPSSRSLSVVSDKVTGRRHRRGQKSPAIGSGKAVVSREVPSNLGPGRAFGVLRNAEEHLGLSVPAEVPARRRRNSLSRRKMRMSTAAFVQVQANDKLTSSAALGCRLTEVVRTSTIHSSGSDRSQLGDGLLSPQTFLSSWRAVMRFIAILSTFLPITGVALTFAFC